VTANGRDCRDMDDGTVRIKELRLRVPGVSADEGLTIGDELAQRIAQSLPRQVMSQDLGALNLRVRVASRASRSQLVAEAAKAILRGLK
jgi:hypothetical protein